MSTSLTNTTVLVVDDDEDTRELIGTVLKDGGANVVTPDSAEAALALYRLILPTSACPICAWEARTGLLSSGDPANTTENTRGFTPAIALTGFAYPGDEDRAIDAGLTPRE